MKPVFANTFNVTHNKAKAEVALSFAHIYTDHSFSVQNGALTDVSAQMAEEVASVLITREGTVALAKTLNRIVTGWGISIEDIT